MNGTQAVLGIIEKQKQSGIAVGDLCCEVIDCLGGFLNTGSGSERFANFVQGRQFGISLLLSCDDAGILDSDSSLMDEGRKQLDVGAGDGALRTGITDYNYADAAASGNDRLGIKRFHVECLTVLSKHR